MISNLTRYGTRAAFPPCHFLLRQNLHSGIVLRVPSSSDAVTVKKKRAGTRTKKLFSELPAVQLKADGSPVTPLAPWTGGLEDLARMFISLVLYLTMLNIIYCSVAVTVVEIVDIGGNAEPTPPDPSVTPKRTRKRKTTKSVQENEGTDTAAPLDTQDAPTATPKPKRTRKAKVANKPTKLAGWISSFY